MPVPAGLIGRLHDFACTGEAKVLYARYKRRDATVELPSDPLLYVPSHPARSLDKDLKTAGIPKHAPGGKIDFHACRVAYINLVLESGARVKEAQTLARHATPEMTMNVYGRARKERLSEVVEQMAKSVVREEKYVPSMYSQAVGAETKSATPLKTEDCDNKKWWRRRESNPKVLDRSIMQNPHRTAQNLNRTKHLGHP